MPHPCPSCGYDLTGVDGPCPECGEPWSDASHHRDAHARHVAILFRLAAGAGAVAAATGAFMIVATRNRITGEPWLLAILGSAVIATGLWLAHRAKLAASRREPSGWLDGWPGIAGGIGCLLGALALA